MVVPATLRWSAAPSPTRVCDSKEIRKPGGVAKSTVGSIQRSSPVDPPRYEAADVPRDSRTYGSRRSATRPATRDGCHRNACNALRKLELNCHVLLRYTHADVRYRQRDAHQVARLNRIGACSESGRESAIADRCLTLDITSIEEHTSRPELRARRLVYGHDHRPCPALGGSPGSVVDRHRLRRRPSNRADVDQRRSR